MIRNRRALTGGCYLTMLFLGAGIAVVGATAREAGIAPRQIAVLLAVEHGGFAFLALVTGVLADGVEKTRLLAAGSVLLGVGFLGFFHTEVLALNLAAILAIGAGMGAYEGVSDPLLIELHPTRQSRHLTVNHFFGTVGSAGLTAYLIFLAGLWRDAVVQVGVGTLALGLFFLVARSPARAPARTRLLERLRSLRDVRPLVLLFVLVALSAGAELTTVGLLPSFLAEQRGLDDDTAKLGLILFLVGMGVGRLLIGLLTRDGQVLRFVTVLLATATPALAVLYAVDVGPWSLALVVVAGLALSASVPLLFAYAGHRYPQAPGAALAALKVAIPAGGALVPAAVAFAEQLVAFQHAVLIVPLAPLVALVPLRVLARRS